MHLIIIEVDSTISLSALLRCHECDGIFEIYLKGVSQLNDMIIYLPFYLYVNDLNCKRSRIFYLKKRTNGDNSLYIYNFGFIKHFNFISQMCFIVWEFLKYEVW
jgi:hypothetical protein